MNVSDLMTKDVVTVSPEDSVGQVAMKMCKHDISGLPVAEGGDERGKGGKVVGLITEEDIITEDMRVHGPAFMAILGEVIEIESTDDLDEKMKKIAATKAGDLMNEDFETVRENDPIDVVATKMVQRHANPIPVLDNEEKLVGVISRADLISILSCGESK